MVVEKCRSLHSMHDVSHDVIVGNCSSDMKKCQTTRHKSQCMQLVSRLACRGCSSVVERSLRMREVGGSIPLISIFAACSVAFALT